ncbi:hypothetical protein ADIMK_2599 [Marinobacterium lacunae]|uniref:DUF1302 domain-containing protein n=1 Tax=Marinobacterium lacunae TaxID=1232683 RepID=A0A081FX20_9GAMM|nr:DUF1302 domain-containing protein [Marinobacterium lacunae]KEA63075.1 hypothetical protein ADIMK_2599 [Marinobacterium lacunae]
MTTATTAGAHPFRPTALACALMMATGSAQAFEIEMGDSDLQLRWDNTVKYSTAFRVDDRSPGLASTQFDAGFNVVGPNNVNQDDGDNNFDKGLVSNRLDLLSEFDARYGNVGARVSAAAWYDDVYHGRNDNDTTTSNHVPGDQFSDHTQDVMGGDAEILDAFVYGRFPVGDNMGTVRLGRHTLLWGESLFFGANGIAGGQAPFDVVKLLSVPNSQFKEVARPTGKLSVDLPLNDSMSLGAYVGYEWEKARLIPTGAYLSGSDALEGERILAGPVGTFERAGDLEPSDTGQYGLQLRWYVPSLDSDLGLYAIRYHATGPSNIWTYLNGFPPALTADKYRWVYHEGIRAYGASIATSVGSWSLAGEISYRQNTPLASSGQTILPTIGVHTDFDNDNNPGYAVGETAHAQFSWLASLGPSFISDEASFVGEVAWNTRVSVDKNEEMLNPNADKSAVGLRMVYTPTYRQLFSGADVSPSVGLGYTWGKSSALGNAFGVDRGGDLNLGVKVLYLNQWQGSLNYVTFFGPEGSTLDNNSNAQFKQSLKDRDFISLSVSTTF